MGAFHEPEGRARQAPAHRLCIAKLRRARSDAPYRFKVPMHDRTDVRALSMNRRFGVPALAGPGRLKAGHQTSFAAQSGSWSRCMRKKRKGALHEPFGVGDKPTPAPSRERDLARLSGSPPGRGWGWVHGRPMHGPQGLCSGITCAPLAALRGPVRKTIRELLPHRKSRCVPDRCR